jgi:hypothetical protein
MRTAIALQRLAGRLAVAAALALGASRVIAQPTLPGDIAMAVRKAYGTDELRYFDASIDLDGDGKKGILVYVVGPMACGSGGCNLLVFTPQGAGYRLVSNLSVTRPPIRASSNRTSGWRDLIVHIGGGGAKSRDVALAFDGRSYPTNPTVPGPRVKPAATSGSQMLIDQFKSMTDGKVLAPNP